MRDLHAGACKPQYLCFDKWDWQKGGSNKNPTLQHPISSYLALDQLLDQLFLNTTYPALNQVVIAGHSLGGQAVQRYAVLKKTKVYDPNVRYWIANQGSWAYLTSKRPNSNTSVVDTYDQWPYGLHQDTSKVPAYARKDVVAQNGTLVAERFRNWTVGYAFGLMDIGAGVTATQAMWQGRNYLDRGSKFIVSMGEDFSGGFPTKHTVDFVANMTHQDYGMCTANMSLQRLFWDGLRERNPWLTNVTNPGDTSHNSNNGTHKFATPQHERMARGLLDGSCGAVAFSYYLLFFLFTNNYDGSWEDEVFKV